MKKTIFRLPGSTDTTTSAKAYFRAWDKIIKPLERLTGFQVTGYDPGLNLCKMRPVADGKTAYDYSMQIPVEFARAILEGAKRLALVVIVAGLLSGCATCKFEPKLITPTPDHPAQIQVWTW
jgi:hypothetical protein